MEGLREAEENILECLGSGHRLLYNLAATKKLASIKKQHEEIVEGLVLFLTFNWRDGERVGFSFKITQTRLCVLKRGGARNVMELRTTFLVSGRVFEVWIVARFNARVDQKKSKGQNTG